MSCTSTHNKVYFSMTRFCYGKEKLMTLITIKEVFLKEVHLRLFKSASMIIRYQSIKRKRQILQPCKTKRDHLFCPYHDDQAMIDGFKVNLHLLRWLWA